MLISERNMEQDKSLTPKQIRGIHALLTEPTILMAAKKSACGYNTLRKWLKKDPTFQAALAEASQKLREQMWQDISDHYHILPPTRRQ
jgi:hypothetical protein